jgi:S-adenosylmethionine:tRNA ribosyltransferase-isomerase
LYDTAVSCRSMDPASIFIKDYSYILPADRIAKYPLEKRDISKLLIYRQGKISEDIYKNLDNYIPANSLLIFNKTKVIQARILFKKETGGVIEIFCLEPHNQYPDIGSAMQKTKKVWWHCLVGGASKWKHGQILEKKINTSINEIVLQASYIKKEKDNFIIEFNWFPEQLNFSEVLIHTGVTPLPPYIKREAEKTDADRYQTIYAQDEGSVAAPTAGLHFTKSIFEKLASKNILHDFVTLHVGAGTFKPVKNDSLSQHEMHAEFISISRTSIEMLLKNIPGKIISVGTTSFRTLESFYWLGIKTYLNPEIDLHSLHLLQWESYELSENKITAAEALKYLLSWMNKNKLEWMHTKTSLIILPGYKSRISNALITNFHQPKSTLLLLVAALIGEDWRKVYDYALQNNFRFLSYGDGSLLWIKEEL